LFGEAMVMWAFFITTFVFKTRVAVLIGIFMFILGLLFETFVFSNSFLGFIWFSKETIDPAVWSCLVFLPFFNFGFFFLEVTTMTTGNWIRLMIGRLDMLTNSYVPGPGFPWSALYNEFPKALLPIYGTSGNPTPPIPVRAWEYLIMNFFGILKRLTD
jgi:hypothetical protein